MFRKFVVTDDPSPERPQRQQHPGNECSGTAANRSYEAGQDHRKERRLNGMAPLVTVFGIIRSIQRAKKAEGCPRQQAAPSAAKNGRKNVLPAQAQRDRNPDESAGGKEDEAHCGAPLLCGSPRRFGSARRRHTVRPAQPDLHLQHSGPELLPLIITRRDLQSEDQRRAGLGGVEDRIDP